MAGGKGESVQEFRMVGMRLTLSTPAEVATSSDEQPCQDNGKDGRQAGAEGHPMDVDERKSIVGLFQADVTRLIGDTVVDGKAGVVFHVNRGGDCSGTSLLREIFFRP